MNFSLDPKTTLPDDGFAGALIGRAWLPQELGPAVVLVREDGVYDITRSAPTVSGLLNGKDPLAVLRAAPRDRRLGGFAEILGKIRYLNQVAISMSAGLLDSEGAAAEIDLTEKQLHEIVDRLKSHAGVEG